MKYKLFSDPVYINNTLYCNNDYDDGIDVQALLDNNAIVATAETPETRGKLPENSRVAINSTTVARGDNHGTAIRGNLVNHSTDGNGNTAIYGYTVSMPNSFWQASLHGETHHLYGTSIGCNIEVNNYSYRGDSYGIVLNNTSGSTLAKHPITGNTATNHPRTTALLALGSWNKGIVLGGNYRSGVAIEIKGNHHIKINGHKVLHNRIKGWDNPSTPSRKRLSHGASNDEIIEVLNTLIKDLSSHGLIGE